MKLPLVVCALVGLTKAWAKKDAGETVEFDFVRAFVVFHHIQCVCIVTGEGNPWTLKLIRMLASEHATPTSVLGTRSGEVVEKGANNIESISLSFMGPGTGLWIMRLQNLYEDTLFKEIFIGKAAADKWLVVTDSNFAQRLKSIYFPLNNKVIIANFSSDGKAATLWEIYQVTQKQEHRISLVGRWVAASGDLSDETTAGESETLRTHASVAEIIIPSIVKVERMVSDFGLLEAPVGDPPLRRTDLTGLHLRCTTKEYKPLTILKYQADGTVRVEGLLGKVFDTIKEITNFTFTCRHVGDGEWGVFKNGRWTGLIKEVAEGVVDIAIGPLSITSDRSTVVDFLINIVESSFGLAMRRPSNDDYVWSVYTRQFDAAVWCMMVITVAVVVVCLYFTTLYSSETRIRPSECTFVVAGLLFGQGTTVAFHSAAGRTIILTVLLLQVVSLAFYTSNLVSALTVGPPLPSLKDLRDVHNDPTITFGFIRGSSNTADFRDSSDPVFQAIWRELKDEDLSSSDDAGMERVFSEKYVLMIWELYFSMHYGTDCRVFLLPARYMPTYTSPALPKDSPLAPIFNKLILDIISSGVLSRWLNELSFTVSDCSALTTAPIELKTVLSPFLVLGLGALLSFILLAAERYLHKPKGHIRVSEEFD